VDTEETDVIEHLGMEREKALFVGNNLPADPEWWTDNTAEWEKSKDSWTGGI